MTRRRAALLCALGIAAALVACANRRGDPRRLGPSVDDGSVASLASLATSASASTPDVLARIQRAEDLRHVADVPAGASGSEDVAVRRAAARAYARIAPPDGDDRPLLRALEDDDAEVVAWAAYGLGEACAGREDAHVRALAARLASLAPSPTRPMRPDSADAGAALASRAVPVALRAIGRCGGGLAEGALTPWLRADAAAAEAAAYALGDIAGPQGSPSAVAAIALLDADEGAPPVDAALWAFSRGEGSAPREIATRLAADARSALGRAGPARLFAVRALGRTDAPLAVADLVRVWTSADATLAERVEAARGLGRMRPTGPVALASALVAALPPAVNALDRDPVVDAWTAAIAALGSDAPAAAEAALWTLARHEPAAAALPGTRRRASELRCAAGLALARGTWDADILRTCDVGDGEAGERARLAAVDRGPLVHARRAAWRELARSPRLRVREAALKAIGAHPELGDAAGAALAAALSDERAGVVATAADVVRAHPDRVALPKGAAAGAAPEPDAAVAQAMRGALARPWPAADIETRAALIDAALALRMVDEGRAAAQSACADPNAALRARAAAALASLGAGDVHCDAPPGGAAAPEVGAAVSGGLRLAFETDAGALAIRLDPAFAPVAVVRVAALARAGFYDGLVFHRVVPGFVAQFGDPDADGFGGSRNLLRCETAPVPFGALDVGVALAGRDTGSSQLFVTQARYPQLDGAYTWIGRAEGDWSSLVEGDAIRAVHVE